MPVCSFGSFQGATRYTKDHREELSMGERTRVPNNECLFGAKKQSFILERPLSKRLED